MNVSLGEFESHRLELDRENFNPEGSYASVQSDLYDNIFSLLSPFEKFLT